ncbi:transposase [Streptomyces sp. NPDC050400]|uniref:transposase n=1 Tax=Streptomyces sp. NPDC050400 TaxID=3365610 RepID=UPI003792EFA2
MVPLSAQGMAVPKIAEVTFTSPDRVRDVVHNFNADGFVSLYPKYKGGRPRTFALPERREIRIAIICDNYSPHLMTNRCQRVGTWAAANNVEIACIPTHSSWLNRIEAQFTALHYFALDGTDHPSHRAQGSMIRRYIIWRNKNAADKRLRALVRRASAA